MHATSFSLLDRLKTARADDPDWGRLQGIYLALIVGWLRRVPGLGADAEDLAQDVLVIVAREIPAFDRRREGSFRAWLRQVTLNRIRTWRRRRFGRPAPLGDPIDGFLEQLADPVGDLAREWDREHDALVIQKLLAAVKPDFNPTIWDAFQRFAVDGVPAAAVAGELGISENAVIQAKSRILRRLRAEAGGLLQ